MEPENQLFTGEHFIVVDRRDRQAVLRAILELEQTLSPAERSVLREKRQTLVKAVLGLKKEYARFDTVLEEAAERINEVVGALRNMLADRRLFQAKDALYAEVLSGNAINALLTEEQFTHWQREFQ